MASDEPLPILFALHIRKSLGKINRASLAVIFLVQKLEKTPRSV